MLYFGAFSTPYHFYSARDCLSAGDIALSGRATCSNFAATVISGTQEAKNAPIKVEMCMA